MHPKTILITGISSGIGNSFIKIAAKEFPDSHIIAFTLHNPAGQLPSNVKVYLVDITNRKQLADSVEKVLQKYKTIDVLINNAGNGWRGMIEDTTIDEAKEQMEINVWAAMRLTQLILPVMRKRRRGHIINISSMATNIDYATIGYYSATKAYIEKLSKVLAKEVAPWNIHVSIVAPGAIKTKFGHNMININKYGKGSYKKHYKDWADKFETMFARPIIADEVAKTLIKVIKKPQAYSYVTLRDRYYGYLKRILPSKVFNKYLQSRYMNL